MKASSTQSHNRRSLDQQCLVHEALAKLALRWKVAVLHRISLGHATYGAIQDALPGITDQVLAKRLRELVREGLVEKSAAASYALTPSGQEAMLIAEQICQWAKRSKGLLRPE